MHRRSYLIRSPVIKIRTSIEEEQLKLANKMENSNVRNINN